MRPEIEAFCGRDEGFKPLPLPNFAGAMLSFDDDTGVSSVTLQFDGGYQRTRRLCWSEIAMRIIEGEPQLGDETFRNGHHTEHKSDGRHHHRCNDACTHHHD